ncbi:MAG: hypothetical protein WCO42_08100 [bacterium]
MRLATVIISFWLSCVVAATARLGETQAQCEERYGQAVTNFPGCDDLVGATVYLKDGVYISVLFVKSADRDPYAGMVIYSRVNPYRAFNMYDVAEMSTDEETVLIGTVNGRWEGYTPSPGFTKVGTKPAKSTTIDLTSFTQKHRDNAVNAVQKAVDALYFPRVSPDSPRRARVSASVNEAYSAKDFAHIGLKIFAFRIVRGVAFCSSEAVAPIKNWAADIVASRDKSTNKKLSGF